MNGPDRRRSPDLLLVNFECGGAAGHIMYGFRISSLNWTAHVRFSMRVYHEVPRDVSHEVSGEVPRDVSHEVYRGGYCEVYCEVT